MPGRLTLGRRSADKIKSTLEPYGTGTNNVEVDIALVTDLRDLEEITLAKVVECLIERYKNGNFYTFAGAVLIALNPLTSKGRKSLPVNLDKVVLGSSEASLENPDVFCIGKKCLESLFNTGSGQVIVVSGDSGAGKTTVTQQLLCYFIQESNRVYAAEAYTPTTLDKKIYFATIVLESLGNASTSANSNSSRFGRFIQLHYDVPSKGLVAAKIRTCLLEKHRVSKFEKSGRNFHIFYYVLAGITSGTLDVLDDVEGIGKLKWEDHIPVYFYSGEQESDAINLQSLIFAFQALKLSHELRNMCRLIFGIMLMLGIHFIPLFEEEGPESGSEFNEYAPLDEEGLATGAQLFGVDPKLLSEILVSSTITVHGGRARRQSVFRKTCSSAEECDTRKFTICSALYNVLFDYILRKLNSLFNVRSPSSDPSSGQPNCHSISLLDLYGFESLTSNSLEQLCINYANERLQLVQIQTMKSLENELRTLDSDLIPSLELFMIEAESEERLKSIHTTIFLALDEACLLNRKVSDADAFQRVKGLTHGNKFIQTGRTSDARCPFVVKHYAAEVNYRFVGMIDKNSDNVPDEFRELFKGSSNAFIRSLFNKSTEETLNSNEQRASKSSKREKTILQCFKLSVDDLVSDLVKEDQDTHFIKCVRPSDDTQIGHISPSVVKRQLFSAGLVDVIKITGNGFPIRILHAKFKDLFHGIVIRIFKRRTMSTHVFSSRETEFRIGLKQIFLTEEAFAFLKKLESFIQRFSALVVQRAWKLMTEKKKLAPASNTIVMTSTNSHESGAGDVSIQVDIKEGRIRETKSEHNQGDVGHVGQRAISVKRNALKGTQLPGNGVKAVIKRVSPQQMVWLLERLNLKYYGGILTRGQLSKTPVRFHIRKTPLSFSHFMPKSQGLNELLLTS